MAYKPVLIPEAVINFARGGKGPGKKRHPRGRKKGPHEKEPDFVVRTVRDLENLKKDPKWRKKQSGIRISSNALYGTQNHPYWGRQYDSMLERARAIEEGKRDPGPRGRGSFQSSTISKDAIKRRIRGGGGPKSGSTVNFTPIIRRRIDKKKGKK